MTSSSLQWLPGDVLTRQQLADRLQVKPSVTYRWPDCPRLRVGREHRFVWGDVLDYLRTRSANSGHALRRTSSSTSTGRGQVFSMPHRHASGGGGE